MHCSLSGWFFPSFLKHYLFSEHPQLLPQMERSCTMWYYRRSWKQFHLVQHQRTQEESWSQTGKGGIRTYHKEKEVDGSTESTVHKRRHEEQLTKNFHKTYAVENSKTTPPEKVWSGTILAEVHGVQKTSCCSLIYSCNIKCEKSRECDVQERCSMRTAREEHPVQPEERGGAPVIPDWPFQTDAQAALCTQEMSSAWAGQSKTLKYKAFWVLTWNSKTFWTWGCFSLGVLNRKGLHIYKHLKSKQLLVPRIPDR